MERVDQFFNWVADSLRNALMLVLVFSVILGLGVDAQFFMPQRMKAQAIESAQTMITEATTTIQSARGRYDKEAPWYLPGAGYIDGLDKTLKDATLKLSDEDANGANKWLDLAKSESDVEKAIDDAKAAQSAAQSAINLAKQVTAKLDGNKASRATAQAAYDSLLKVYGDEASGPAILINSSLKFYKTEAKYHRNGYTTPLSSTLTSAMSRYTEAGNLIAAANILLPSTANGKGDPTLAQTELNTAKAKIDEINTLAKQVTAGLQSLFDDRTTAPTQNASANARLNEARGWIDQTVRERGYSKLLALATAESLYSSANDLVGTANSTLVAQDADGLIDWTAARAQAKTAYAQADASYQAVTAQRDADDHTRAGVVQFDNVVGGKNNEITNGQANWDTLNWNHASDTWNDVRDNITTAKNALNTARDDRRNAETDWYGQKFLSSAKLIDSANNGLTNITNLVNAISSRASSLEGFRSQWPGARDNAQREVDANSGILNNHPNEDRTATANYIEATTTLQTAKTLASQLYFQDAVSKANRAQTLAAGTKAANDRAYRARLQREEEERQAAIRAEQERREAEARAAAQKAADDAARAAADDDDSDYGGGSSCCSGGSSSGGSTSDYGGGSSDDGGGSDSDYDGGGSDSDY